MAFANRLGVASTPALALNSGFTAAESFFCIFHLSHLLSHVTSLFTSLVHIITFIEIGLQF
jgi:hypothetical protein